MKPVRPAYKHGELPDCGSRYKARKGVAYCPACGTHLAAKPEAFKLGDIVRYTSEAARSIFGSGALGMPINGRVVGSCAGTLPIVEWSDGHVAPVASSALEQDPTVR